MIITWVMLGYECKLFYLLLSFLGSLQIISYTALFFPYFLNRRNTIMIIRNITTHDRHITTTFHSTFHPTKMGGKLTGIFKKIQSTFQSTFYSKSKDSERIRVQNLEIPLKKLRKSRKVDRKS